VSLSPDAGGLMPVRISRASSGGFAHAVGGGTDAHERHRWHTCPARPCGFATECGALWARLDSNQGPTDYESKRTSFSEYIRTATACKQAESGRCLSLAVTRRCTSLCTSRADRDPSCRVSRSSSRTSTPRPSKWDRRATATAWRRRVGAGRQRRTAAPGEFTVA
jgi:hypothetical protein